MSEGFGTALPAAVRRLLGEASFQIDEVGQSGSSVLLFEDKVLKIQDVTPEAENEARMLEFLQGKLPVPRVYACEAEAGKFYLLMGRCPGLMACATSYMENPDLQCELLAAGLRQLWSVDIGDCPASQCLEQKLAAARYNVEHGLVDLDDAEPATFGEGGFQSPAALLEWLDANRPEEEPVFSHGDFCLPNILGTGAQVSGFIDLGRAGAADRWCDIALCYRSISHNYSGAYGKAYPGYDGQLLFRKLGLRPDWEKIRYYILLDELF